MRAQKEEARNGQIRGGERSMHTEIERGGQGLWKSGGEQGGETHT